MFSQALPGIIPECRARTELPWVWPPKQTKILLLSCLADILKEETGTVTEIVSKWLYSHHHIANKQNKRKQKRPRETQKNITLLVLRSERILPMILCEENAMGSY